jgi:DNA-binding transcriptional regulator YiaG
MPGLPVLPRDLSVEDLLLLSELRYLMASGRAREIREAARVSQGEAAIASGVTNVSISLWEARKRTPSGAGALRYAHLLRALANQVDQRPTAVADRR